MKKAKEKIYAPWQHRFIAGIFGQLGLFSDRDVALYLQRESSFPKDGMAEAIFRSFAKGMGKFPKPWKEVLLKNCNQAFIDRWRENIFSYLLNQENPTERTITNGLIETRNKSDKPKPTIKQTSNPLIKKVPKEIVPPVEESNETSNITPKEPLDSGISIVSKEKQESEIIANDKNLEAKEINPPSESTANEPGTEEVNPLPESIIKILTVSLSESMEKDGKLNPRKLVRALNTRSNSYKVKRTEREIFFQGKRVTHKFTIPSDIEITAQ